MLFLVSCAQLASAQEANTPPSSVPRSEGGQIPALTRKLPISQATHRFWDRENVGWFAGVGASRALDYSSTLNMRRRGRQEILLTNEIVDDHPLFAGIEAAATAASIGVSYLFHRTGHHRLERLASIVHVGATTAGAVRNYSLGTAHPRRAGQ